MHPVSTSARAFKTGLARLFVAEPTALLMLPQIGSLVGFWTQRVAVSLAARVLLWRLARSMGPVGLRRGNMRKISALARVGRAILSSQSEEVGRISPPASEGWKSTAA